MRVTTAIGNGFGVGSSGTSNVAAVTSSGSLTYVQKLQFGSLGNTPVSGPIILTDNTTNSVQFYKEGGGTKTLADPAATSGIVPAASDVRSGVVFSSGNRTGTLAVPAAGSVALGVAVDNTTGTAVLTQANVRTAVGMASANLDSQLAAIPTTAAPTATAIRTEMDSNSTKLANLDATVSSRSTYSGADTSGTTTLLSRLTSGRASGLDNLDATVSSRLAASSYTAPPSASSIATAVWANATRTLTAAVYTTSDIASAVWAAATRTVTGGTVDTASNVPSASAVAAAVWSAATRTLTTAIDNSATIAAAVWGYASGRTITGGTVDTLVNSPSVPSAAAIAGAVWAAADKTGYSLTNAERQAISVAVQAGILNESDGQQILNAIVGAIGNQNVDQVALVAAIRADLERTGGTLATRLAASAYTTPPTSAQNASAVRSELATELGRIDATVSSRLAPSGTLARVTFTDTATTLSNAPTVPTPQEIATATREELTPELARVANAATTQEVGDIVQEAMHP